MMRSDLYTKAILTVIAAALIYLCVALTPVGVPVQAQGGYERVYIAGWIDEKNNPRGVPMPVYALQPGEKPR
jgi:hypothetical protein